MPRYYFNIRSETVMIRGPDGPELPDLSAARAARDLLAELLGEGAVIDGQVFEISDADGEVLEGLPVRSVLRLP
jgi:hypothetical protein